MRIAALVKQIPCSADTSLGENGYLQREGVELEMNAYCRRAVSQAVKLALLRPGTTVTVITMGPPTALDVLREAIAWGLAHNAIITGILITDPELRGSDTFATAHVLAATLQNLGSFDLVLTGLNSLDANTGQVGAQVAELTGMAFLAGAREVILEKDSLKVRCEHDDGWLEATVSFPALVSCAERLCDPAKVEPHQRSRVPDSLIRQLDVSDLGPGTWGHRASLTTVGPVHSVTCKRAQLSWPHETLDGQVSRAITALLDRGTLDATHPEVSSSTVPLPRESMGPIVAVILEPERAFLAAELLGTAALLAEELSGHVVAIGPVPTPMSATELGSLGADTVTEVHGTTTPAQVAREIGRWAKECSPWAILGGSTAWGREVAARSAVLTSAGLTGDATGLKAISGRLIADKPAFGGRLIASITASSMIQMATIRCGVLPHLRPRHLAYPPLIHTAHVPDDIHEGLSIHARGRNDDLDALATASTVIGIGCGVSASEYPELDSLTDLLDAQRGATRKVTDVGWMPRSRQIGITGRNIAPRLFVSIGASGSSNHTIGFHGASHVLAINVDPTAPIFEAADVGIVGDWHKVVPLLVSELRQAIVPS